MASLYLLQRQVFRLGGKSFDEGTNVKRKEDVVDRLTTHRYETQQTRTRSGEEGGHVLGELAPSRWVFSSEAGPVCKAVAGLEGSSGRRCNQIHTGDQPLWTGSPEAQQRLFSQWQGTLSGGVPQRTQWSSMEVSRDHNSIVTMYVLIIIMSSVQIILSLLQSVLSSTLLLDTEL